MEEDCKNREEEIPPAYINANECRRGSSRNYTRADEIYEKIMIGITLGTFAGVISGLALIISKCVK